MLTDTVAILLYNYCYMHQTVVLYGTFQTDTKFTQILNIFTFVLMYIDCKLLNSNVRYSMKMFYIV